MTPEQIVAELRKQAENYGRCRDDFDANNQRHAGPIAWWQSRVDLMNAAADYIEFAEKVTSEARRALTDRAESGRLIDGAGSTGLLAGAVDDDARIIHRETP